VDEIFLPRNLEPHEALLFQVLDEFMEMVFHLVRDGIGAFPELHRDVVHGVLSVEELPYEDARRVEAEGVSRVRVEEDGLVVEFLAQDDERVGYGLVIHIRFSFLPDLSDIFNDST